MSGTTGLLLVSLFLVWTVVVSVTRLATRPADPTTGLAPVVASVATTIVFAMIATTSASSTMVGIEIR